MLFLPDVGLEYFFLIFFRWARSEENEGCCTSTIRWGICLWLLLIKVFLRLDLTWAVSLKFCLLFFCFFFFSALSFLTLSVLATALTVYVTFSPQRMKESNSFAGTHGV